MYLGIDVGGTKTLVAALTNGGRLLNSMRFQTPKDYNQFLDTLASNVQKLKVDNFRAVCIGLPGMIDREKGVAVAFGNLPWTNIPIRKDLESLLKTKIQIENDSKLAALSEAINIKDDFKKVLYLTISTGISAGLVTNGVIDSDLQDSESGQMILEHDGKMKSWESFASGKALVKQFGKRASELTKESEWQIVAHNIAVGLIDLVAVIQPEVIVIGGGVGAHLEKFKPYLVKELDRYQRPLVPIPPIKKAAHPEEAVIFGCYELLRTLYG